MSEHVEEQGAADEVDPATEAGPETNSRPAVPEAEPVSAGPEHAVAALRIPDDVGRIEGAPYGARRSVAIAVSRFNGDISTRLLEGALTALADELEVTEQNHERLHTATEDWLAGVWADRRDVSDAVAFVRRLRRSQRPERWLAGARGKVSSRHRRGH